MESVWDGIDDDAIMNFLERLSFSDLCFSSVTVPKLLQNMQCQVPFIPYAGCLTQMYFFLFFGDLESFLLVAMAYDRYVVICFPLHYTTIMSPKLCLSLVVLCWALTTFHALLHTLLMPRLSFCVDKVISHFFCDMSALLKLACSNTRVNELVIFIMGGLIVVIPFLLIIVSYARIFSSFLKVPSSHANNSTVKETIMSLMYTVATPMLEPFIYSLRNRDMKGA
ncbi:Olfactory receptor-like protein DTMT [Sciurus carolinensis]|uniref:Olfactory receptor n=1 Tax=Sciurus carolinensis TaxID=30640 RepID=A0AA41MS55_SCICA|nr:Olfactory receptor-like protein DTMT [Sciurus carolinensis]